MKTLAMGNLKRNLKKQLLPVPDFESFYLAFRFTLNKFASPKQANVRNNDQPVI